jgi:hypothetical protein
MIDMDDTLEGKYAGKITLGLNQRNAGLAAYYKLLRVQEGASPDKLKELLEQIKNVLGLEFDQDDDVIALTGGKLTAKRLTMLERLLASKPGLVRPGVNQHNAGLAANYNLLRVQEGADGVDVDLLIQEIEALGIEVGQDDDVIALTGGTLTATRLKMLEDLLASNRDLVRAGLNQHKGGKATYCNLLRVQKGADGVDVDLLIQEIEALGIEVGQDDDEIALTGGTLTATRLKMLEDLLASNRDLVCGGVNQSRAGESSAPRRGLRLLLRLRLRLRVERRLEPRRCVCPPRPLPPALAPAQWATRGRAARAAGQRARPSNLFLLLFLLRDSFRRPCSQR